MSLRRTLDRLQRALDRLVSARDRSDLKEKYGIRSLSTFYLQDTAEFRCRAREIVHWHEQARACAEADRRLHEKYPDAFEQLLGEPYKPWGPREDDAWIVRARELLAHDTPEREAEDCAATGTSPDWREELRERARRMVPGAEAEPPERHDPAVLMPALRRMSYRRILVVEDPRIPGSLVHTARQGLETDSPEQESFDVTETGTSPDWRESEDREMIRHAILDLACLEDITFAEARQLIG